MKKITIPATSSTKPLFSTKPQRDNYEPERKTNEAPLFIGNQKLETICKKWRSSLEKHRFKNHSLRALANELWPVLSMEELAFGLVGALVGVGTEEVSLGLEEVGRKSLGAVSVVVSE